MNDATGFTKLVPGFDFLQDLVKNAGAALPSIGQWVAPTLNPEELDKRIDELRTVQFWLEQNAKMLGATIQALEVQRMTLSTLKTMNVQMADLRESLQLKVPPGAGATAAADADRPAAVDPMQWWGALTQQFTQLASAAMQDGASGAAKTMADAFTAPSTAAAVQPPKKTAAKRAPAGKKPAPRKRAVQRP